MFYILGFSLGYDSSGCLIRNDGKIIKAISEERLTRIKNDKKFPFNTIKFCLENIDKKDIKQVCYSNYEIDNIKTFQGRYLEKEYFNSLKEKTNFNKFLKEIFKKEFQLNVSFFRSEHHYSHAIGALACSGFKRNITVITSDGFGDGFSSTISRFKNNKIVRNTLFSHSNKNSLGMIYQYTTGALGYKQHRDEWKLLGLEAQGYNNGKWYEFYRNLVEYNKDIHQIQINLDYKKDNRKNKYIKDFDFMNALQEYLFKNLKKEEKENIAASLQRRLEEVCLEWVQDYFDYYKLENQSICLSGGVFMNVKLNNKIMLLPQVKEVFVLPFSGDLGCCIGSCYDYLNIFHKKLETLSLGKDIKEDLNQILQFFPNIKYETFRNQEIPKLVAYILSQNKIINVCIGKSEFAPRALLNRSTLYTAEFSEVNDWLNKACNRDRVMPYAPVLIENFKNDLFENVSKGINSGKNMTITFICKDEFTKNYPAAMHKIINSNKYSARPQIITDRRSYKYKILKEYYKLTGKKAIINTSFNVHNSPIVTTCYDAIRTFIYMGIEDSYLLLHNKLISYKKNKDYFNELRNSIRGLPYV